MTNLITESPTCQSFIFPQVQGRIIQRDPVLVAVECPACGRIHRHGVGITPLRMSHCVDRDPILYRIIVDDTEAQI